MVRLTNKELLHVSKGDKSTINHFRLGVHLSTQSGLAIDRLADLACRDRFKFARETLSCARRALHGSRPEYRIALGRAYYAMYHAARAVVFFVERGDDFEAHIELPRHIPRNFPESEKWENELKTARHERNKADYDPYPRTDRAFANAAAMTVQSAEDFLRVAKRYLVQRGCEL